MKMPTSVGTKKAKAVEQLLEELGVGEYGLNRMEKGVRLTKKLYWRMYLYPLDLQPMPTEHICQQFNELRNEMILLYELKQAAGNCEFEKQTLK